MQALCLDEHIVGVEPLHEVDTCQLVQIRQMTDEAVCARLGVWLKRGEIVELRVVLCRVAVEELKAYFESNFDLITHLQVALHIDIRHARLAPVRVIVWLREVVDTPEAGREAV